MKFKKCLVFTNSVRYLPHIVKTGILEIKLALVKCLTKALFPWTPAELRSFHGFANVYRRFFILKGKPKDILHFDSDELNACTTLVHVVNYPAVLAISQRGFVTPSTRTSAIIKSVAHYSNRSDREEKTNRILVATNERRGTQLLRFGEVISRCHL